VNAKSCIREKEEVIVRSKPLVEFVADEHEFGGLNSLQISQTCLG